MANARPIWLDHHQKQLEALLLEGKSTKEIAEVFTGTFKYPTINSRAIETRKKLGIEEKKTMADEWAVEDLKKLKDLMKQGTTLVEIKRIMGSAYSGKAIQTKFTELRKSIKADPGKTPVSKKWQPEEIDLVIENYSKGLTFAEIEELLEGRTAGAIQTKVRDLISAGTIQKRERETAYTEEQAARFQELVEQRAPLSVFFKEFPERNQEAIKTRFYDLTQKLIAKVGDLLATTLNWDLFAVNGICALTQDQWPLNVSSADPETAADPTSLLYLISRQFLLPVEKGAEKIRHLILEAESGGFTGIRFYFAENRADYESNLTLKKSKQSKQERKRQFENLDQENLIFASLLADGYLEANSNKFQLTQAATLLVHGGHSHLEYLLNIFFGFSEELLTAVPLELSRGLALQEPSTTLYSWKIRFNLFNFEPFEAMHAETYYQSPPESPQEKTALKQLAAKILSLSGAQLESIEKVFNFPRFVVSEIDEPLRNYKNLPSTKVLMAKYFVNSGLTLAHLHMQDGRLQNGNICCLFIQTTDFARACRLAKCIFEKTGLRYFPKIYKSRETGNPITVLQLCEADNAKFLALTSPYLVKWMDYKKPPVLRASDIDARKKEVLERHAATFDYFYKTFVDPTL